MQNPGRLHFHRATRSEYPMNVVTEESSNSPKTGGFSDDFGQISFGNM
jgi:hypothetical protein